MADLQNGYKALSSVRTLLGTWSFQDTITGTLVLNFYILRVGKEGLNKVIAKEKRRENSSVLWRGVLSRVTGVGLTLV